MVAAGLLVAGGAAAGSGTAALAATELRLSHYGTTDDPVHAAAERFKKLVQAKTGGEVVIVVHPDDALGEPRAVLQGVRVGEIDLAVAPNPAFAAFEPAMGVLDLPFLFESPVHAYAVLDGEVGRGLLDGLERHNMKGLAMWEVGFRDLTNSVRPIRGPSDLMGLTISTAPDPTQIAAFQRLGASATPLDGPELYEALRAQAVAGQEGPAHDAYAGRLYEVQGHLSLTRHAYTAAPLVMNLQRFNSLPAEQRRALLEAAQAAAEYGRARNAEVEREAIEAMRRAGVEVVEEPDVEAFREVLGEGVRAAYVAEHGDGVLERIDALRPTAEATAAAAKR